MERRSKQQKYVQMIIANNPNPVSLKLNKDNALEISFLPQNKDSNFQHDQIWIPPPAKTSKRLSGSQKYPKNNIIINIPADRTIESTNGQTLRIESGKKQEKMIQEKLINSSLKKDDKISELQEQTQRMKGTFDAQEHILGEAEELLKKHENKQKILSKYCRALKKNIQDITKSIKELENQDYMLRKTKSREKAKEHYNNEVKEQQSILSSLKQKTVYKEIEVADISEDENIEGDQSLNEEYSPGRKLNDFDEGSQKQNLKRTCSIENVSLMYLPINKSIREESEESDKRQSNRTETKKDKTRKQMTTQPCIPTENLMMKLSDNMRKTKLLIDAVYQEDEDVDLVQRKYVSEIEKLYREQQELLEKLYQNLDTANSDATTGSFESFQVDDAQNQYDNTTEKSSEQGQTKEMKSEERLPGIRLQKETRSLEDRLEYADKKLTKLKDELEATKTPQSKYEPVFNEKKYLLIHRDLQNSAVNQSKPGRPSLGKRPVMSSFKKDGFKDIPNKIRFNDSFKSDDYSCQTEITQVVRHLPSDISGNPKNNPKADDASKNDSYISETKITQKLRFLPLNSKEKTMKTNIALPITDILKDINRSIDNVKTFGSYTLPEIEYVSIEEGSLTLDDTNYKGVLPKAYSERETSKTQDESTKISERSDYNKKQKYQTQMEYNKHKENGTTKSDFDREEYSLTNDNSRHKDVLQKSYNKNGTSEMQGETTEISECSDNDETRQKYQMTNDYKQHRGNEREIIDFKRKPTQSNQYNGITGYDSSQSFTQLSTIEECDCSGECTNSRHFIEFSSYRSPPETEDKSKKKFIFLPNERPPLAESSRIDDTFDSRNDYQNKRSDPSGVKTKIKQEKFSFYPNQTPLAESTRIDGGIFNSETDYKNKKFDPTRVENKSRQENNFKFFHNQTPVTESTKMDYKNNSDKGFKSQNNRSSQTDSPVFTTDDSAYQYNFQSDLYSQKNNAASDSDDKNYEKAKGTSNDASDQPIYSRNMQTTLNEFLYTIPIIPKEKFPDTIFASSPKKVIQCEYNRTKSIPLTTESGNTVISNMEKASDKINALYKDIMSQF
ncbi:hypothetical protein AVEN_673-1 [Araneus ventricosus]|uniref:Uncharacterized protein n=1 Tax=Araneus ventricosus TaxID=182803 RepID=A0A4Y2BUV7_ARAVE|nr:hypothetical protein AVEN_673-1 [Araneus ventricosus]